MPDFSREGNIMGGAMLPQILTREASVEIWIELKGDEESKSSCFYTQLALKQREFGLALGHLCRNFFFFFFFSRKHYITAWTLHPVPGWWRPRMQRNLGDGGPSN